MGQRECVEGSACRKKVDDLVKNVDDHGASCLRGPSEPGMLADVVGRVVPRPAMESDCDSGSMGSSARCTNRTDASQKRTGNNDGAIQPLPLLEEALMAVESGMGANSA